MVRPRWLRVAAGAALTGVPVAVVATSWDALRANNPAYPLALALALVLGAWLVFSGLRPKKPPKPGGVRAFARSLAAIGGVAVAAALLWLEPFVAEPVALDALESTTTVQVSDNRARTVYTPTSGEQGGFVLYPGARVDPRAYAVLAQDIATRGFRVVVLKCPFDLALLCTGAAEQYLSDEAPWSVGGHSLGGTAASSFAADGTAVDGLVFWASYPVADLSGREDLTVASISGSADGLATPSDIESRADLLPADTAFTEVSGAVHSSFGDYGAQPGDGEPTVEREVAQQQIVRATVDALETASR
jgi:drug/metabolite transporter superfamily protein YnfA